MAADWFRKNSWSQEDQAGFWQHLTRTRKNNRAQYVFIQGYTLMQVGPHLQTEAIALFDHVIERYPDSLSLVQALSAKADCLADSGDIESALLHYDRAVHRMRIQPSNQTWAWLEFAWLIATRKLSDRYGAALDILDEFGGSGQLFPVIRFRFYACRALIQSDCGFFGLAADAARTALNAAAKETSGLRYHPKLGLVGSAHEDIRTRLRAIARLQ